MIEERHEEESTPFVKIEVEGTNPKLWDKMKSKLMETLTSILDANINPNDSRNVRDELQKLSSSLFSFANSKLQKPSMENAKLGAEIESLLAESAKKHAEARKTNAEAEQIEFDTKLKKLKVALQAAVLIANSEGNEEAILFCKNIEPIIGMLQSSAFENSAGGLLEG